MPPRTVGLLVLLSAIWGSSFMFIKVGVDELEPSVVVFGRLVVGSLVLLPLMLARGDLAKVRRAVPPIVLLGALNNALPFWLLGFAGTRIDSGLSAEIQASAPLLTVLLSRWLDPTQQVRGARLIGIAVGFGGVALLVGGERGGDLVGALAVIGTAACYGGSVLFAGRHLRQVQLAPLAFGQILVGAVLMAPFAVVQLPHAVPSGKTLGAVVALGALGTGIAYLLYFTIIRRAGASSAILVTYLVPAFALMYGAGFLDEGISARQIGGLALVLGGTGFATGLASLRSRE